MITADKWKWYGLAGHFICGQRCQFHLCTKVGKYLISSVGNYFPDEGAREILAESRGIKLEGRGDMRRADYIKKIGYEDIGFQRKFETFVFIAWKLCSAEGCDCGQPTIDGCEIHSLHANTVCEATRNHMKLCNKYSKL